ncbi:MAG: ATP-binding protein [Eubacterium sp.]|nr:ATP-binding protein [Eubacterium sp.]
MDNKEYKLNIDPRILELLGPSLYTNIYYIIAELVANAYDADAHNVFIIDNGNNITVEDDGKGMSYSHGEVDKYLNVARVSRNSEDDSTTNLGRKKMGRKGVGKLAALSVSENVLIKTVSEGEKSGFVLSRSVKEDRLLKPLSESEITFQKIQGNGTAVVMVNPEYKMHATLKAVRRNLLKIFPMVGEDFKIHIIRGESENTIECFDSDMIKELSTLITLGEEFEYLKDNFDTNYKNNISELCDIRESIKIPITMFNKDEEQKEYTLEVKGWIGTYLTTRGRKVELTDFPDNFISLFANKKMGEFNILPVVGQNKLNEVYVVGQLHVDLFELTELPDMALSNRQGYKTDDPRYQKVLEFVKEKLLPDSLKMRDKFVSLKKQAKKQEKIERQKEDEKKLRNSVDEFKKKSSENVAKKVSLKLGGITDIQRAEIQQIVEAEINANSPDLGIKSVVDNNKKKILISQTYKDKDLADIVFSMLLFNGVPVEDIIYTNCDDEKARIPETATGKSGIYDYLRDFFVNSYSTQKLYIIFVTSENTKKSWGALTEVGATWITQIHHKIFNIADFRPEHPLDDESQWHTSIRDDNGNLMMSRLSCDIFAQKIETVCKYLGYKTKDREANKKYLETLVKII